MKSNSLYWIKSGFFSVLQNISSVFIAFGIVWILVRLLSQYNYGVWVLFSATATILEITRNGLVQNALIKFLAPAEKEEQRKIISASFVIGGVLTIICILINLCFASYLANIWETPELELMFHLYCLTFVLSGFLTQFNCVIQANLQFKALFISSFIMQFIFFTYALGCFILHFEITLIHLVYVQMFTYLVGMGVSYSFAKPYLSFSFNIDIEWIRKLFNYGKYAFGTSISSMLSVTVDQMMLGAILSPIATSIFSVAVKIMNMLDVATNALSVIVFPQSARRIETGGKEAIKYLYEKTVGTLLAILIPAALFLFLFSSFVVNIIAGPEFADSIPVLHIILLYSLLTPYGRLFGTILDSIGKTRLTFFVVLIVASLNLGLNYVFIINMGVMGAAYATLCSMIIGTIIGQGILRRELNVSIINTFIYAFYFYPEFVRKYITHRNED